MPNLISTFRKLPFTRFNLHQNHDFNTVNKNKNENNYHNVLIVDLMVGIKPIVSRKVSVVTSNIFPLSSYPYGFYKNPATSYYNSPP